MVEQDADFEFQFKSPARPVVAPALGWREGRFANWTVVLGDRRFKLHKYNLAKASSFFEAAMTEAYESSETDLSEVLPKPTWECFEDVLDFIYQEGKEHPKSRGCCAGTPGNSPHTPASNEDGILACSNVVPLLNAADILGLRDLFERAVAFLRRKMGSRVDSSGPFQFWKVCLEFPQPLSAPLEKLASIARGAVMKNFERLLETDKEALLQLPSDALLDLLREDDIAVRSELRLACFVLEYGWRHGLVPSGPNRQREGESSKGEVANRTEAAGVPESDAVEGATRAWEEATRQGSVWWSLCASLRWGDLETDLQYGFESHLPLCQQDLSVPCGDYVTRAITGTPVKRDVSIKSDKVASLPAGTPVTVLEVVPMPEEDCIRGRIAEPAGYISMINTKNSSSWVIPARSQLKHFVFGRYFYLADYFPEVFVLLGMAFNRAQATWMCHLNHQHLQVPHGISLLPRTPVRPPHAPALAPHQVEQFFYFAPDRWRQGDLLRSPPASSGMLRFQLNIFPGCDTGWDVPEGGWAVSAYVMVVPEVHWMKGWELQDVEFSIQCVPWKEGAPELQFRRSATSTFTDQKKLQVGWKGFISSDTVGGSLNDLLSPEGYLLVQAEVLPESTIRGPKSVNPSKEA